MNLLKLKAKVKMTSEQNMEIEGQYDLGIIAKSTEWVWKDVAVPVEEVYKVIAYSNSKSIVQMYDNERILVAEAYEGLVNRWEELRDENPDKIGSHKEAEEQTEEDDGD